MTENGLRTRAAQASGREVERTKDAPSIGAQIRDMQQQFQMAAPRGVEAAQLVRDALTCLRTIKNLDKAEPKSVLGALMTAAQLGLRPGVLGHCWPLPFYDSRMKWIDPDTGRERTGGYKAQLIIGYQGLVELAHRSGRVADIVARTVYESDTFDCDYGLADKLVHKPNLFADDRGKPIAYYAIVRLVNGGHAFWVMSHREMEKYRDENASAKTKEGVVVGPWRDNFEGMAHKGLALDTPIPTVTGWTTMGEVEVGDRLFDMYGKQCTVRAKSEVKHIDCYRVTFANGASLVCDGEHLWDAAIGDNAARTIATKGWQTYEITDLYAAKKAGKAVVMPVIGALETPTADLLVDPWLLGYWLGDGASANASLSVHADHVVEVSSRIEAAGYKVGAVTPDTRSASAVRVGTKGGLAKDLADIGVLGHKHVPKQYLRASADQRLALLQGLVDSDGSIDATRGRVRFVNTDKGLADAVAELARGLGEMVYVIERQAVGFGTTTVAYEVGWQPVTCPATISQKVERFRPRLIAPYRSVASIERVDTVPTQCIAVDSPTRTYAAGIDMTPTHNTCVRQLAKWMPKSTELATAIEVDGSVRVDVTPDMPATEASVHVEIGAQPDATPAAGIPLEGVVLGSDGQPDPTLDPSWGQR